MLRTRGSSTGAEAGSVSLVMIGLTAVAAALVAAIGVMGAVSTAASRAQGSADASALAAAAEVRDLRALGRSVDRACEEAKAVAAEWETSLDRCVVDADGGVTVTIGIQELGISIERTARAGRKTWG